MRAKGLEPVRREAREPKSRMSTNSITPACFTTGFILAWIEMLVKHLFLFGRADGGGGTIAIVPYEVLRFRHPGRGAYGKVGALGSYRHR